MKNEKKITFDEFLKESLKENSFEYYKINGSEALKANIMEFFENNYPRVIREPFIKIDIDDIKILDNKPFKLTMYFN